MKRVSLLILFILGCQQKTAVESGNSTFVTKGLPSVVQPLEEKEAATLTPTFVSEVAKPPIQPSAQPHVTKEPTILGLTNPMILPPLGKQIEVFVTFQTTESSVRLHLRGEVSPYRNGLFVGVLSDPSEIKSHRVKAIAICPNSICDHVIVNLHYLVNNEIKNFQTEWFKKIEPVEMTAPPEQSPPNINIAVRPEEDVNEGSFSEPPKGSVEEQAEQGGGYVSLDPEKLEGFKTDLLPFTAPVPATIPHIEIAKKHEPPVINLRPEVAKPLDPIPIPPPFVEPQKVIQSLIEVATNLVEGGEARNFYFKAGQIMDDSVLPESGVGFVKTTLERDRRYGSGLLVQLIIDSAKAFRTETTYSDNELWISDISQKGGGDMHRRDSSNRLIKNDAHQNGLDVDIAYLNQNPNFNFQVVNNQVLPNFDFKRNFEFMRLLVKTKMVGSIFVDPRIKKGFCGWFKREIQNPTELDHEVLERMYHVEGHTNHFHVRLKCSPNYILCVPQGLNGDGLLNKTPCN